MDTCQLLIFHVQQMFSHPFGIEGKATLNLALSKSVFPLLGFTLSALVQYSIASVFVGQK